jgi:uncharacterized protein
MRTFAGFKIQYGEINMIHKFRMHDTNIVLDVNSGAVHVLDDLAYNLLDGFNEAGELLEADDSQDNVRKTQEPQADKFTGKSSREDVLETLAEIKELKESGQLFSEDIFEEYLSANVEKNEKQPVVKALCLHIAHDCNLRCRYCFASTGDFGTSRTLMSAETGKKAIEFLIEKSGARRNLEVDFFGGEPMLNFETVKQIVEYALERSEQTGKNFRFTLTTNAVLLKEEHRQFINKYIGNIVLSIDGRPEVNDNMRLRVDGRGTYSDILPKIKDMADSRGQEGYYVRGTFTRENLDFSQDVLHLADLGFKQISIEPVVAAKDSGFDIRQEDLAQLFSEYENLAMEYVKRHKESKGFNFFHFMLDLDHGPCVVKRLKGCGSGHEYLAVTPEGDLYPCHQFVGMEKFKMGNVNNDTTIDMAIREQFVKQTIYSKPECRECWARFFCSGGCAANAWQFNNCLDKPYSIGCELERKRVECALWAKVME